MADQSGAGEALDRLDRNGVAFVHGALRDYLPALAQHALDRTNETIGKAPDWPEDDAIATECEQLSTVARVVADLGRWIDGK